MQKHELALFLLSSYTTNVCVHLSSFLLDFEIHFGIFNFEIHFSFQTFVRLFHLSLTLYSFATWFFSRCRRRKFLGTIKRKIYWLGNGITSKLRNSSDVHFSVFSILSTRFSNAFHFTFLFIVINVRPIYTSAMLWFVLLCSH